jgi:hypothetical protein
MLGDLWTASRVQAIDRRKLVDSILIVRNMIANYEASRETLKLAGDASIDANIRLQPVGIHIVLHRILAEFIAHGCCAYLGWNLTLHEIFATDAANAPSVASQSGALLAQLILEGPLRASALLAQTRASMWLRNGLEWKALVLMYGEEPRYHRYRELDLFLMQCAAAQMPRNLLVGTVVARFQLIAVRCEFARTPTTLELEDRSREVQCIEHCLLLLLRIISNRRLCRTHGSDPESETLALLRQELCHALFISPATFSTLMKVIPKSLSGNSAQVTSVLDEIAVAKRNTGGTSTTGQFASVSSRLSGATLLSGPVVFHIKPEYWSEFDPYFATFMPSDTHAAEESYSKFLQQQQQQQQQQAAHSNPSTTSGSNGNSNGNTSTTSNTTRSSEELLLAPYCKVKDTLPSFEPLLQVAQSRRLHALIFWCLFEYVHQVEAHKYGSATIVSRVLHLIHLALDAREAAAAATTTSTSTSTSTTPSPVRASAMSMIAFECDDIVANCIMQIDIPSTSSPVNKANATTWRNWQSSPSSAPTSCSLLSILAALYRSVEGSRSKRVVLDVLQRLANTSEVIYSTLATTHQLAAVLSNAHQISTPTVTSTASGTVDDEETQRKLRREAARRRQQEIMGKFAAKQRQFLNESADAVMDDSMEAIDDTKQGESVAALSMQSRSHLNSSSILTRMDLLCVLCREQHQTHHNPIGLVAHIHSSGIVDFIKYRWKVVAPNEPRHEQGTL